MRKFIIALALGIVLFLGAMAATVASASTSTTCITVVDSEAYVIHHDAVTHTITVIDQEAIEGFWANFSPNETQGTYTGTPSFPTDAAGTWHVHYNDGGPAGGPGVFFVSHGGSGNGDWFYRQPSVPEVSHEEIVVDTPAYDEEVPAVTHEECVTTTDEEPPTTTDEVPPVEPPVVVEPPTVVPSVPAAPKTPVVADTL